MDTTIETVVTYFPDSLGLTGVLVDTAYYIPAELDFITAMNFLLFFAMGALVMSLLGRFVLGKGSSLNHSVSCVMGILCVYAAAIVLFILFPWDVTKFPSPLPFITFSEKYLTILPFSSSSFFTICSQTGSMIFLTLLINLLDTYLPRARTVSLWYLLRILSAALAFLIYFGLRWTIDAFVPAFLAFLPALFFCVLLTMMGLGFFHAVAGLFFDRSGGLFSGLYTFFFYNTAGKQITKAFFTSAILALLFYILGHNGYTVISLSTACLSGFLPLLLVALILWYLIGHLL